MAPGPFQQPGATLSWASFGSLRIDYAARQVELDGRRVSLTKSEFALLGILSRQPRIVVSREQLLSDLWETTWLGDLTSIEVHISRLRGKLGESALHWRLIQTIRGIGYMFTALPDEVTWVDDPNNRLDDASIDRASSSQQAVVGLVDVAMSLAWVSSSVTEVLGWHAADLVGLGWSSLNHVGDLPLLASTWATLMIGQPHVVQVRMRHARGHYRAMLAHFTPMFSPRGAFTSVVAEWQPSGDPGSWPAETSTGWDAARSELGPQAWGPVPAVDAEP